MRTTRLPGLTLATGLLLVACASHAPVSPVPPERPNILLVVVDDLGFTDLGVFGSEIETPNIDALAARGVRFTNFRVSVSCSPTRSMLLSGVDNHQAGMGTMGEMLQPYHDGQPGYEGHLNDRVASLAEVLRDGGYHTVMAGKWHLGHGPGKYPADRGFERTLSLLYGGASHWDDMSGLMEQETPAHYTMNGRKLDELPADFYSSRSYADFLMDSIREGRGDGQPFLAYLAFTSPHDPIQVPEPWRSKYAGRYDAGYEVLKQERVAGAKRAGVVPDSASVAPRHPAVRPWDSLPEDVKAGEIAQMQAYAGMVENMDYHFGRVSDFLEDIGAYENTVIVFLSDNGPNPWSSHDYPTNEE
nr:sulfatase-like hydrolase/transferase [Myxococcota bacterium]